MTGYCRPRNKTLVRCGQSDQGSIYRPERRFAVIRLGNFGVYFLFKVLWRWRYTVSTLKLLVFPATI
jgi:hypothetical protein